MTTPEFTPFASMPWLRLSQGVFLHRLCICLWLSIPGVPAAQADTADPAADVRILIDVSGSMKQNDPSNLRRPAVELLLQLIPQGSKAGIWTFGQYVNMLVPHRAVSADWKREALANTADINSLGLFTNMGKALERAAYDAERPRQGYRTSLILLTDGMVDIDRDPVVNQQERQRLLEEVLPRLQQAGYTIHTVALSDNADRSLLQQLALATDGMSAVARTADELMPLFLRIFDRSAPSEQLPLAGNRFLVDSSVEEFTALIFRQRGTPAAELVSPDGAVYRVNDSPQAVAWYHTSEYDLVTLKQPQQGEWLVQADMAPDSRITVVSNLKLWVKPLPGNLLSHQPLTLSWLLKGQLGAVVERDFLRLLSAEATLKHDSASPFRVQLPTPGEERPEDGMYHVQFGDIRQPGAYEVTLTVDGITFQRQFQHHLQVRNLFTVALEPLSREPAQAYRLKVHSNSSAVDPSHTQIVANIKGPAGHARIQPLARTSAQSWSLDIEPQDSGDYRTELDIRGAFLNGEAFAIQPDALTFTAVTSIPATEVAPSPVPAPPLSSSTSLSSASSSSKPPSVPEPAASNLWLYGLLAGGNLVILLMALLAYRIIAGSGQGDSLKELEKVIEETDNSASGEITAVEAAIEPGQEADAPVQPVADVDDLPMDTGLDLSSDEVITAQLPSMVNEVDKSQ